MPSWPSIPPADGKLPSIRIVRTPASGAIRFTSFSAAVTGAMTHYAANRTQLCTAPACDPCDQHQAPRWYGYLATYNPKTGARRIFEFPRGPYNEIRDYLKKFRDLRGAQIKAYRQPARANGPVQLDITGPDESIKQYPDEVDVFRLLCQIWKLHHVDQLQDYNQSNLRSTSAAQDPPNPTPAPHAPTSAFKHKVDQYSRGLNLDHLKPTDPTNGPD